ncbi:hypothetical protein COB11_00235 [Candidatus Aerophobetes bacterium]|uniref:Uncharacterized protein n=1 Tax=Aerophobetes bacterium TaxID=2030807 RepID=A0A2A4YN61_UNCAE|nr:MAG: hypothetical protein COB11_00235 [Candidatus Aerophobetes bacterium]
MQFSIFFRVLTAILCSFTLLTEAAIDYQKVYVANSGSDSVSVINTATDMVSETVGVGNFPRALAIATVTSPDTPVTRVTADLIRYSPIKVQKGIRFRSN